MEAFFTSVGGVSVMLNLVVLFSTLHTNGKISELKVYIHENFQRKEK